MPITDANVNKESGSLESAEAMVYKSELTAVLVKEQWLLLIIGKQRIRIHCNDTRKRIRVRTIQTW